MVLLDSSRVLKPINETLGRCMSRRPVLPLSEWSGLGAGGKASVCRWVGEAVAVGRGLGGGGGALAAASGKQRVFCKRPCVHSQPLVEVQARSPSLGPCSARFISLACRVADRLDE